jgi:hypothetical protein
LAVWHAPLPTVSESLFFPPRMQPLIAAVIAPLVTESRPFRARWRLRFMTPRVGRFTSS